MRRLTHTGRVVNPVRAWFEGSGWLVGAAGVLMFFTVLMILLELQSPDVVLWTGRGVVGTEQGGIISYRWKGETYTTTGHGFRSAPAVTVYVDPADPSNAMPDSPLGRAMDGTLIGGPFAVAMALLALGPARNYRRSRSGARAAARRGGFGDGLGEEFVSQRLKDHRRDSG